jgi:2-polyprenyl-6-methoxyphenol hydroxylase-like FAD-dependent oxidoreductase
MTEHPILIVGGGIGGIGAGLALARAGHRVQVFERSAAFGEIGAGIQLGPNVMRMFERLGVKEAMLDIGFRPAALVMRDAIEGSEVARVPLGAGFEARFGQPYGVIHRADLHAVLLDALQAQPTAELLTERDVEGFAQDADGVTLRFKDGASARGRALIGADGLWSRIRQQVIGDGKPIVSGHIAYRAVLPMDEVPPGISRDEMTVWVGPRVHLVHYRLRRGALMNLVAVFHSDRYAEGWNESGDVAELERNFAAARPEVRALLSKINAWKYWVLCWREPRRGWSQGRVTLLGDAAHPTLQYLAQGANQALEDAVCLTDMLAAHGADLPAAFRAYEDARVLRTGRVQLMSKVYGEVFHAAHVTAELRNAMLANRTPEQSWDGMAWLYDGPVWPHYGAAG